MKKTEIYIRVATGEMTTSEAAARTGIESRKISSRASQLRRQLADLMMSWDRMEGEDGNSLSGFLINSVHHSAARVYLSMRRYGEDKAAAMALKAQVEYMLDHQKKVYSLWGRKDSPVMAKINELAEVE